MKRKELLTVGTKRVMTAKTAATLAIEDFIGKIDLFWNRSNKQLGATAYNGENRFLYEVWHNFSLYGQEKKDMF